MRVDIERDYWNKAAEDPEVDDKYISSLPTDACLDAVGEFSGTVLEIGCGVGRLMKPGYWGIDISQKMLDIAQQRKPDCHFKLGDGRNLPLHDDYFDAVYSVLLFQHLPPQAVKGYIDESYRVLRDGGKFRFQFIEGDDHSPFGHHYSIETVKKWLENFTIKTVETGLVHYQWTWITAYKEHKRIT